jgi:hypothetical protein
MVYVLGISVFFLTNFVTFSRKIFGIFFHNINVTNFSNIGGENAKLSIAQNWGKKKLWDS